MPQMIITGDATRHCESCQEMNSIRFMERKTRILFLPVHFEHYRKIRRILAKIRDEDVVVPLFSRISHLLVPFTNELNLPTPSDTCKPKIMILVDEVRTLKTSLI